jgi:uncharacterized membrane protein
MTDITTIASAITAAFLASFVEVVEAFTIMLAVGVTQGWRPAFIGAGIAAVVLAALVLLLGPLLSLIPVHGLQFAIGVLLILFGMRWLRKAILRSSGILALHDEAKAFTQETDALRQRAKERRANYLGAVTAFKAVLLEGVEVVFIVIAVGTVHGLTLYASLGALGAVVLVLAIGLVVHRPLSHVPENALKFVVGLMLTSFGIFWTGEGLGAPWPGADLAILGILAIFALFSAAAVGRLRRLRPLAAGETR